MGNDFKTKKQDRSKVINIPVLNDFIYTVLYNASFQEKRGLTGKYLKIAMNKRLAKVFSETGSIEQKQFLLSHFGFKFFYVICKNDLNYEDFKEIVIDNQATPTQRVTKISAEHIYLHSDKEFQRYLGLASHHLHHPNFQYNNQILRNHYHIQKWKKTFQNKTDIEGREMDEAIRATVKFIFDSTIVLDNLKNLMGIPANGLKVLLYLYQLRESFIGFNSLKDVFAGYFKVGELTNLLRMLDGESFISSLRKNEEGEKEMTYTITSIGIRTVNNYFNHVYNQNSF